MVPRAAANEVAIVDKQAGKCSAAELVTLPVLVQPNAGLKLPDKVLSLGALYALL